MNSPNPAVTPDVAGTGTIRRAIVVLGMHRSGTSAVAGCLQRLGVELGPRLMPATEANRKGYYEHIDVVNLHDRLLMTLGLGWDSVAPWPADWQERDSSHVFRQKLAGMLGRDFGNTPLWGIKDPRLCRLLPWWEPLWPLLGTDPIFLIVVRDPRRVAASLQRRDGISQTKALVLWWQYMLAAERDTRGRQRFFLDFTGFAENWSVSLKPLATVLGEGWLASLSRSRDENQGFLGGFSQTAVPLAINEALWTSGLKSVWDWFKAQCGRVSSGECLGIDDSSAKEWVRDALLGQSESESISDIGIELQNARKLGAWYQAEWNKAADRAAKYKARGSASK